MEMPTPGGISERPEMKASPGGPAGVKAGEIASDVQDLILSCNKDGMENLRAGNLKAAFEQFKYAEAILLANQMKSDNTALLAVTCNNLGVYYKNINKYHGALSYLRRALKMEVELNTDEVTLAGTHLNLCTILSKLEKHRPAVQHALCALELMSKRVTQADTAVQEDDYAVLAIAYSNVAREREFLEQMDQAATAFQTGYQVAKRLLGEQHPLSLALGKNCEAVLKKAKLKAKGAQERTAATEGKGGEGGVFLPQLQATQDRPTSPTMGHRGSQHNEAVDWVKAEEALWANFAAKALRGSGGDAEQGASREVFEVEAIPEVKEEERGLDLSSFGATLKPKPLTLQALQEMQSYNPPMPKAYDMGAYRFESKAPQTVGLLKQTPLGQALDDHPQALMDIIEAEGDGHASMRSAPNDFRPNRSMKRSTRTSRVVRRTGVFNSTTHRDRVEADLKRKRAAQGAPWKSMHAQVLAAQRIQRAWRAWYVYCQDNSEWMTITWICATMIQSHWRSYHVRRKRMDKHAQVLQRHCRGFLVRCVLKSHWAAVSIQRRVIGMLTRKRLNRLHEAATDIQRLVRGGLARKHFWEMKVFKVTVIVTIQRYLRVWMAKRAAEAKREEHRAKMMLHKATVDLQRLFRGWKGRQTADAKRATYIENMRQFEAARMLQSNWRLKQARRRVDQLRELRMRDMEKAATFVRKVWLGARTKKKYLALKLRFEASEHCIVTIQRYVRGCLCRLRLWREAVRTEEELWAVVEIQRSWRGYTGRVKWENTYEQVWKRQMMACVLQRNLRGWIARLRVARMRRKIARAEFEWARDRFRAAQRIQAVMRGMKTCRDFLARHRRRTVAAIAIQRIARGHVLRVKLWRQIVNQRATMIAAAARGYLVRNRRFHLLAKIILLQQSIRRWRKVPIPEREARRRLYLARRDYARKIQRQFRVFAESKQVQSILAAELARQGEAALAA